MRLKLDEYKVTVDPDVVSVEPEGLIGDVTYMSNLDDMVRPSSTEESFLRSAGA